MPPFIAGSSQGCHHQPGSTHTRLAKANRRIDRDAFLNLHAPKIGLISRYGTRPWLHGEPASSGGGSLWPLGGVGDRQGHGQPGDGPERPGVRVPAVLGALRSGRLPGSGAPGPGPAAGGVGSAWGDYAAVGLPAWGSGAPQRRGGPSRGNFKTPVSRPEIVQHSGAKFTCKQIGSFGRAQELQRKVL